MPLLCDTVNPFPEPPGVACGNSAVPGMEVGALRDGVLTPPALLEAVSAAAFSSASLANAEFQPSM